MQPALPPGLRKAREMPDSYLQVVAGEAGGLGVLRNTVGEYLFWGPFLLFLIGTWWETVKKWSQKRL